MKYIKLMRVHQWIKNGFVFLPLFFSGQFLNVEYLYKSFVGFFCFSFVASAVYIINDYVDVEKDRNHPEKKHRPIASGAVSKNSALILFFILLAVVVGFLVYINNYKVLFLIALYFFMNLAYSFKLKHIALIDITIISFGFLLRLLVGGYVTGILISDWAIVLTFSLALIMAIGKRRGELINEELTGKTRKALGGYNLEFINVALAVSSTVMIVAYLMYVLSDEAQSRMHHNVLYTVIFVILGVLRYLQQTFVFNKTESPTKMIFKDHFLQVVLLLWGISFAVLIYFKDGYEF
ncbi:MAG: decaprenyl-phosphate phosphoribosyltransferase [Flavobacteriales bacterium]|nr:decaprenyl-phosphate phosphoribosyltransferase [Flavobacteriales bacterium]